MLVHDVGRVDPRGQLVELAQGRGGGDELQRRRFELAAAVGGAGDGTIRRRRPGTGHRRRGVERRWGSLVQQGALFSSLTVRQNIQFPVREYLNVTQRLLDEITVAKLGMVGLKPEVVDRFPSELSGGMIKRVALARALALDPELVFLDEPTSGLDPIGAGDFDELVRTLQRTLGLTVFMVTHDLDSLYTACDRIAVLGNGKIIAAGSMADMQASQHPWLRAYFHGKRARAVMG